MCAPCVFLRFTDDGDDSSIQRANNVLAQGTSSWNNSQANESEDVSKTVAACLAVICSSAVDCQ